jgi:rfaE bifunctional protein nucleotidyltransferase chain/domain
MRTVLANGVFDPFHFGHLLHLEAARQMGSRLVVSVTSDAAVKKERGEGRPMFDAQQRARVIDALHFVGDVIVVDGVMEALRKVRPSVFVKGSDYAGRIGADAEAFCRRHGIEIRITDTPKWSATEVVRELRSR